MRSVYRFVRWHLRPDREPDAAPRTFQMACDVCALDCEERRMMPVEGKHFSPLCESLTEAQDWVFRHVGRNPDHHTFTEIVRSPWLATPAESSAPLYV